LHPISIQLCTKLMLCGPPLTPSQKDETSILFGDLEKENTNLKSSSKVMDGIIGTHATVCVCVCVSLWFGLYVKFGVFAEKQCFLNCFQKHYLTTVLVLTLRRARKGNAQRACRPAKFLEGEVFEVMFCFSQISHTHTHSHVQPHTYYHTHTHIHTHSHSLVQTRPNAHTFILLQRAHRKVLTITNTLGLSNNVMRMVERRTTQDKVILFVGMAVSLFIMYLIYQYFVV